MRAFGSPHRYVQGPGTLEGLRELLAPYGRRVFVVCDETVKQLLATRLKRVLEGCDVTFGAFGGECTEVEIARMAEAAKRAGAEVIVGLGGGKAIDTAKGARIGSGCALAVLPTVASNDSPTSRLVVIYDDDHVLIGVRLMDTNPDLVLVDTEILVAAPARFFVAGVGDALSKKFEVEQCRASCGLNFYKGKPTELAVAAAERCYDIIRRDAEAALGAVRAQATSDAFERVVEATILLSGLGFESGGLSIAHSLTRGLSAVAGLSNALHGEQVAYGLLVQLALEGRSPDFMEDLRAFYGRMGLPRSLRDLGLSEDVSAAMELIARRTVSTAPYIRQAVFTVDEMRLLTAMRQLESWTAEEMRRDRESH